MGKTRKGRKGKKIPIVKKKEVAATAAKAKKKEEAHVVAPETTEPRRVTIIIKAAKVTNSNNALLQREDGAVYEEIPVDINWIEFFSEYNPELMNENTAMNYGIKTTKGPIHPLTDTVAEVIGELKKKRTEYTITLVENRPSSSGTTAADRKRARTRSRSNSPSNDEPVTPEKAPKRPKNSKETPTEENTSVSGIVKRIEELFAEQNKKLDGLVTQIANVVRQFIPIMATEPSTAGDNGGPTAGSSGTSGTTAAGGSTSGSSGSASGSSGTTTGNGGAWDGGQSYYSYSSTPGWTNTTSQTEYSVNGRRVHLTPAQEREWQAELNSLERRIPHIPQWNNMFSNLHF